jgi:hypothetical protein
MLPERLSHLVAQRAVRLGLLCALTLSVAVALASVATAALSESCSSGTGLVSGALVASDGDQCGDGESGDEYDWEAIADQFGTYVPNPGNPPAAPTTKGISVPDDQVNPDGTAFLSSAKEDNTAGWQVGSSNVNDKVNLYGSWAFPETIGTDLFLYLAFQREAPNTPGNASANIDFELNQLSADDPDSYVENPFGVKVIKRQGDGVDGGIQDDLLIVYDWNGNDDIDVQVCRWEEGADNPATPGVDEGWMTGAWKSCDALSATEAEGEVNDAGEISSFLPDAVPNGDGDIARREFGELSINMTAALGLAGDECVSFGAFHTRSRESGSLQANMPDLILPAPIQLANCGTIVVEKQTDPVDTKQTKTEFPFETENIPAPPAEASKQDVEAFDLADDEQQTITNVEPNDGGTTTYDITEGQLPGDYEFESVECRSSDDPTIADPETTYSGATAQVKVAPGETITCTYVNTEKGSVAIEKVTDPDPDPSDPDTVFTFQAPTGLTDITVANGQTSQAQAVSPGQYQFTEDAAPGWAFDSVTCDDTDSTGANGTIDFEVQPGEDVVCTVVNRLKTSGIDIVKDGPATAYHGDQVTFTYGVTNPEEQSIHDVVVTDDKCSPVTLTGKVEGPSDTGADVLDPGDTWSYSCTTTMGPHADGEQDPHVNVATVTGKDEREQPVSDTDPHATNLLHPGIALEKTGPAEVGAGQNIVYSLVVTNTGDTSMAQANVNFTDPRCDLVAPERVDTNGDASPGVFDPNDAWTFTCTATTTVGETEVTNVADVCGTDTGGKVVCARDDAVTVVRAPIQVVAPQRAQPGSARLQGPTKCVRGPFNLRVTGQQIESVTVFVGSRRVKRLSGAGNVRIDPRKTGYAVQRVRVVVRFTAASGTSARTYRATFQRCPKRAVRPQFTG